MKRKEAKKATKKESYMKQLEFTSNNCEVKQPDYRKIDSIKEKINMKLQ